jgi:hypothetical protein
MKKPLGVVILATAGLAVLIWALFGRHSVIPTPDSKNLLKSAPAPSADAKSATDRLSKLSAAGSKALPPETDAQRIKPIVQNWWAVPQLELVKGLTSSDLDALLRLYRQETNLVRRRAMTLALGFAGEERAVPLFTNTLTGEFRGRRLMDRGNSTVNEEGVMLTTLEMLGMLAAKSDAAYDFLKRGLDPVFWQQNLKWSTQDTADEYGVLAGRALGSLAYSGRPEIPGLLQKLKDNPMLNTADPRVDLRRTGEGSVVDAAFWYDLTQQRGLDYIKRICGTEQVFEEWNRWKETQSGRRWRDWSTQRRAVDPGK